MNFDDNALRAELAGDQILKALADVYGETDYLFFDEIQNYPRWESLVNKQKPAKDCYREAELFITGYPGGPSP